jgi:hypothetical protein
MAAGRQRAGARALIGFLLAAGLAACTAAPPDGASTPATRTPSESSAGATTTASATTSASPTPSQVSPTPAPPPTPTPSPPPTAPSFTSTVSGIDDALAARMAPSWRPGCPVPLSDLRYVTVSYLDFDGTVQTGELVVHADVADAVVSVFADLFAQGYPIRSMRLVDDFDADDTTSMEADNTSAFNCRAITGGTAWSEHAYGRAIDLNPVENPYVVGNRVEPESGRPYAGRPDLPGVIHDGDAVVRAFADAGWLWGGDWSSPVDYQHFSVTGR